MVAPEMIAKVTLDHNCIISLEKDASGNASPKDTENAQYLKPLIALHNPPIVIVSAAAIGASEHLPTRLQKLLNGQYNHNFADYEERIAHLGLLHMDIPMPEPVGYWGRAYWGHFVWNDPVTENLEKTIHTIMFPNIDFNYETYYGEQINKKNPKTPERINKDWNNAKCDVLAMWSHINAGGTIFTTADDNMLTKKAELIKLGAGDILNPQDTLEKVREILSNFSS